jgi:L-arabinokinase
VGKGRPPIEQGGLIRIMTDAFSPTSPAVMETAWGRLRRDWPELSGRLQHSWIVWAPGSLDVMGGLAECTGSLTLSAPTAPGVHVVVVPRDDQRLRVVVRHSPNASEPRDNGHDNDGHRGEYESRPAEVDLPLAAFYEAGQVVPAARMRARLQELGCRARCAALAVVHTLLAGRHAPHLGGGADLLIASELPMDVDARHAAALQAAVVAGFNAALNLKLDPMQQAAIVQRAQRELLDFAVGAATPAAPLFASPGSLAQIWCRPFEVGEPLELPAGVTVIGVHCGVRHPAAEERFLQARTAALMGAKIIERMIAMGKAPTPWGGYLAQVSITDYVDRFRDRLPTKLKGAAFLDRFGPLDDPLATIDPAVVYKVRSRAEHHIYEDERVQQFAERLRRASRTGDEQSLREAGELMYASHWSYGQRCGLGSIETDLLVNLIRAQADKGVYGARVSGIGSGGTVVALITESPETSAAVQAGLGAYREKCKRPARLQPMAPRGSVGLFVERCAEA